MNDFRSGFVAIIGRPNVGKSTLLNRLIGERLAITTSKPQTTRNSICGVLTGDGFQAAFIDTPGLHEPKSKLGGFMVRSAESSVDGVDACLFVTEADGRGVAADAGILARLASKGPRRAAPVILLLNKIDKVPKPAALVTIEKYTAVYPFAEIIPLSALTGDNADGLVGVIKNYLPEGPPYFPDDYITDRPEKFLISEIIRGKALTYLQDEIPHGVAVEAEVKDKKDVVIIDATLYCEKKSHKGIIIGKNGELLKKIGQAARADIEALLGTKVFLQTWVKIKKNWRDDDYMLRTLGYGANNL